MKKATKKTKQHAPAPAEKVESVSPADPQKQALQEILTLAVSGAWPQKMLERIAEIARGALA